jgi:pimeloyl-ACP methyl ester carboxylesterase
MPDPPGEPAHGGEHQVTPLEVFFDLVFVFAITQVTSPPTRHRTSSFGAEPLRRWNAIPGPDSGRPRSRMTLEPKHVRLSTGAEMRLTGGGAMAVVCLNGGQSAEVEGTWSASLEWLVQRLAPRFPQYVFAEVRYRVKSWRRLESCVEDARAAIDAVGAERTLLLGFSMGGAVAISVADEASVGRVVGLAPWIQDRLSLEPLRGKRLDVLQGSFDRSLLGVPGVSPASSRRGFERARALGVVGSYELIHGALHGVALRGIRGRLVPLPRAAAWERRVAARLAAR